MAEPTSTSSSPSRVICGDTDETIQVYPVSASFPANSLSPPYNWIAKLSTKKTNGKTYGGTGFKINLPGVNYTQLAMF